MVNVNIRINDFAKANGYSIVREIGGHGVGLEFHEEPFVSYVTEKGSEMLMVPGMVFTIEPMVNMGRADIYSTNFFVLRSTSPSMNILEESEKNPW